MRLRWPGKRGVLVATYRMGCECGAERNGNWEIRGKGHYLEGCLLRCFTQMCRRSGWTTTSPYWVGGGLLQQTRLGSKQASGHGRVSLVAAVG